MKQSNNLWGGMMKNDLKIRLEDLRDWLHDQIDGAEESRGWDSMVSSHIETVEAALGELK
jgi:hypothetical protein